jgi:pimeloyl-ACP methyl ester carboxylesterase
MAPEIHYAKSGDVHIAYQLFGQGRENLIIFPGFISHIEHSWDSPDQSRWLTHLARRVRVLVFDKRGTGLSDRLGQVPHLDQRMDDARAVMDAAGMDRAVIMGISEGGSLAVLFVASHPERCSGLILYGAFAKFEDWFPTKQKFHAFLNYVGPLGEQARALLASRLQRGTMRSSGAGGAVLNDWAGAPQR